jgi:phosphopentomutase
VFTDRFFDQWQQSPFADAYLERLAEAAVDQYKLGRGDHVDYLGVSFSALDSVGHGFGPDSHEVQDTLARLDRTLEKLLTRLDERVGKGKYVLAFTSDHGVAPIPEQAKARGEDAGRIASGEIVKAVDAALVPFLGPAPHVRATAYTDLYFRPASWDKLRRNQPALRVAMDTILKFPGVERVLVSTDLLQVDPKDPVQRAAALSYYQGRSGDLIVVPKRYWMLAADGTTHGTLQDYDQHVPLIFLGAGVAAGQRPDASSPADASATLARSAGVTFEADGHALNVAAAGTKQ